MKPRLTLLCCSLALLPSLAAASCGASFCSVNSNWTTEGALTGATDSFDVRFESIRQDQPMHESDKVAVGQIRGHHDEVSTDNRNLVASYSHSFDSGLGLTISANVVDRKHHHIHHHHGQALQDRWNFTELGDVRVLGRYQLSGSVDPLSPTYGGVSFGVKLPTGKFDVADSAGAKAERSLQPGSGTTDLLVGGFYHQSLTAHDASWFVQALYQHAAKSRDDYRPGAQLGIDLGARKGFAGPVALLAQLNYVVRGADSGAEAEPHSSGGRYLYASPGISYALPGQLQLYAFLQVPVYRHVKGVQLTADRALVVGLSGQL